jgi:membrane fusion protein (multidrug efflux system)
VAIALATAYYMNASHYESTDNAFLESDVTQVSPRISGQVKAVYVHDNQHVNKGDLLVEIDPSDYDARLAEAQAAVNGASAKTTGAQTSIALTSTVTNANLVEAHAGVQAAHDQVEILRAKLRQDEAGVTVAQAAIDEASSRLAAATAEAERAASDAARYQTLYSKDEVSKQMLDRAQADARSTAANRDAAAQAIASAKAQLTQAKAAEQSTAAMLRQSENFVNQSVGKLNEAKSAPDQVLMKRSDLGSEEAKRAQAEALLQQAELNKSYTKIYAVESGFITRKAVEVGNFVATGQNLMALVSDNFWVVANFKETQLAKMRPGEEVSIKVDAYPSLHLKGKVDSIQSGTGSRFSMLPPENATGNYVKVVQRVPVKIVFTEAVPNEFRLGPGMSVEPEVRVQ